MALREQSDVNRSVGKLTVGKLTVREGEWSYSEFPHPLVTLDFDKDGRLLAVVAPAEKVEQFDA